MDKGKELGLGQILEICCCCSGYACQEWLGVSRMKEQLKNQESGVFYRLGGWFDLSVDSEGRGGKDHPFSSLAGGAIAGKNLTLLLSAVETGRTISVSFTFTAMVTEEN